MLQFWYSSGNSQCLISTAESDRERASELGDVSVVMVGRCESGGGSGAIGSMAASTPRFGSFYSGRQNEELDLSSLYDLTKPHVESYDYFVERGLEEAVRRLQPVELKHPISGTTLRYILSLYFKWLNSLPFCGTITED